MDGPFDTGPPPSWDPTTEAWPGGPHPGAIAQMEREKAASKEARVTAESTEWLTYLLLLR